MSQFVEIEFECLPLRTISRLDIPLDASPKFRQRCERIKQAIDQHGSHNSYFLHDARCVFHLTNKAELGMIEFRFEGTVLTNASDDETLSCDLHVELVRETCDWLTEPIVGWFHETVSHAVQVEFDRFIAAGDLAKAVRRVEEIQAASDQQGGYLGMYL